MTWKAGQLWGPFILRGNMVLSAISPPTDQHRTTP